MQKVVGSNPISRFKKGLQIEVFPATHGSLDLLSPRGPFEDWLWPATAPGLK